MAALVIVVNIRAPIARVKTGSTQHRPVGAAAGAVKEMWVNGMRSAV